MDGWIIVSIILLGLAIIVARHLGFVATLSGKQGRFLTRQTLFGNLTKYEYLILEDIKLPYRDAVLQIDHVVVSRYGVFLVESLHSPGRVKAEPHATHWVCSGYGLKSKLVNPLRKNIVHQNVLSETLGIASSLFRSVVVCTGKTAFSGARPAGVVRLGGLSQFIQIRNEPVLEHDAVYEIAERIEALSMLPPAWGPMMEQASARMTALRRALHIGVDRRDPIAGMVRNATGFVLAALILTLTLGAVDEHSETGENLMMASMGADSMLDDSPFVDGPVARSELAAPQVGPAGPDRELQALRQELVQQELDRQLAWEASLSCTVKVSASDCRCRDPLGDPAALSRQHCEYLVAKAGAAQ